MQPLFSIFFKKFLFLQTTILLDFFWEITYNNKSTIATLLLS